MLKVKEVFFSYDNQSPVLKDISFEINTQKRTCILGESGSGKSTLLKLIYGHLDPSSGEVWFKEEKIKGPKYQLIPGHKDMKYVAQDFDLSPYMTVAENVGKHLSNVFLNQKKNRVQEILEVLALEDFAQRKAVHLSGGQMQRVAIARTLVRLPQFLVLDEPFSHLDASLHIQIRDRLMQYFKIHNMGVVFSSHRSDDALGYADELIVLREGKVEQQGAPREIYLQPKNVYVAQLFGKVNVFSKEEAKQIINENPKEGNYIVYPHEIRVSETGITAIVKANRFVGRDWEIDMMIGDKKVTLYHHQALPQNESVKVKFCSGRWAE